jgi:uncharacterized membrane protein
MQRTTKDSHFEETVLPISSQTRPHRTSLAVWEVPEHRVAVTVIEGDAASPVEKTEVALGPYRAATDKAGVAHLQVAAGTYELAVWKSGFKAAVRTVEVAADASVQFELVRLAQELTAWD